MTVNEFVAVVDTLISIIYTHPYLQSRLRFGHRQRQVRKKLLSFTYDNEGVISSSPSFSTRLGLIIPESETRCRRPLPGGPTPPQTLPETSGRPEPSLHRPPPPTLAAILTAPLARLCLAPGLLRGSNEKLTPGARPSEHAPRPPSPRHPCPASRHGQSRPRHAAPCSQRALPVRPGRSRARALRVANSRRGFRSHTEVSDGEGYAFGERLVEPSGAARTLRSIGRA